MKRNLGIILRPRLYYRRIKEQLEKRLDYEPEKEQIWWCYFDYLRYVWWDIVMNTEGEICLTEGNKDAGFDILEVSSGNGERRRYESILRGTR